VKAKPSKLWTLSSHTLVVILACTIAPATAWAQDTSKPLAASLTGMAKEEYDSAKILYEDGDYKNALLKYQRAYELSKDYRLLWNEVVCEKESRHYARALELLERFSSEGGKQIKPAMLGQIAALQQTMLQFTGTVTISVSVPGATIRLDGASVGVSPMSGPLRVDIGEHVFRIEKLGYKPLTIEKHVDSGAAATVDAALEPDLHRGKLIVEAGPKDAISLDGKTMGLGHYEGDLASGGHTLRVTAPGMTPFQTEVVIQDDQTRRVPVTLTPLPKEISLAKWGWIGGGSALLIGAVVTGVLLLRPETSPPVEGTLGSPYYPTSLGGYR